MLRTKSLYNKRKVEDGARVVILYYPKSKNINLVEKRLKKRGETGYLLNNLSPPESLVKNYKKGKIDWEECSSNYLNFLASDDVFSTVRALAKEGLQKNVTLLHLDTDIDKDLSRLLAKECQRYEPSLEVRHV